MRVLQQTAGCFLRVGKGSVGSHFHKRILTSLRHVARIKAAAGIDPEIKFMGLRHGGNTEGADANLSDAQMRALSGHRTTAALLRYAQTSTQQRRVEARLRRNARTKGGQTSE